MTRLAEIKLFHNDMQTKTTSIILQHLNLSPKYLNGPSAPCLLATLPSFDKHYRYLYHQLSLSIYVTGLVRLPIAIVLRHHLFLTNLLLSWLTWSLT